MNADDLSKYKRMLADRRNLLDFLEVTKDPACIVVHVPNWLDLDLRRTFPSEGSRGVFIDDKAAMTIIIDQARQAARAQINRMETELTAAGIEFETAAAAAATV